MNRLILTFVAASLLVTGCASLPSPELMRQATVNYQLPSNPQQDQAIVYVVRPNQLGGLIRFNVFLDNQDDSSEMGYTRAGQYIYFNLTPGEHKIYSKAENWAESLVTVKAGDVVFIQQEPSMGIIMARNTMFKLDDHEGKYHVKTLSLGTILKSNK